MDTNRQDQLIADMFSASFSIEKVYFFFDHPKDYRASKLRNFQFIDAWATGSGYFKEVMTLFKNDWSRKILLGVYSLENY